MLFSEFKHVAVTHLKHLENKIVERKNSKPIIFLVIGT